MMYQLLIISELLKRHFLPTISFQASIYGEAPPLDIIERLDAIDVGAPPPSLKRKCWSDASMCTVDDYVM